MNFFNVRRLFVFLGIFGALSTHAASLEGISFDDQRTLGTDTLVLNGLGVRQKELVFGIKVNVYVAGLYTKHPTQDASFVVSRSEPKTMHLKFLRDVSAQKIQNAWQENFEKNCAPDCDALQPTFAKFVSSLGPMTKMGSQLYEFSATEVKISQQLNSGAPLEELGAFKDLRLARVLLASWFVNPPNQSLKDGLLGLKPRH